MAQGFGPPLQNFAPLANLGQAFTQAYDSAQKRGREQEQRQTLAMLGQTLTSGNPDYMTAAGRAIAGGNVDFGLGLIKLGEAAKERQSERDILKSWAGETSGAPSAPAAPGAAPTSLIQNESGGNWQAQNNAVGAGGQRGHFGRLQFGQARLQEAAAAGAIPAGTTPQQFMASPEMQQRAEAWHWNDIDNHIRQTGLDRAIGQTINGVPVTLEGMRAVAHLGGKKGLSQFIATGGRYNPADENGTRLSDYFARHGGSGARTQVAAPVMPVQQAPLAAPGVQVAENEADVQRLEAQMAGYGGGSAVASVAGDDPIKLRQEAARYQQSNPEAARQFLARADAAERAAGTQMAQAPGQTAADLPPQGGGASLNQFAVPGAPVGEQQSITNDPNVRLWSQRLAGATTDRLRTIAKQQLDLAVEDAKRRGAANDPTGDIKEYNFYRQQQLAAGKQPDDFTTWVRGNKAAGASNVNVDTKQEGEYAKTIGKSLGERMDAISKEGDSARQDMAVIGQLRQLGGQIKNLGAGAALQSRLAEWGIKVGPNVSEIEAFNALVDKLTPQQRVPGSGASSDLDVRMFKSALPNLIRTPGGNELILSTLEAVAQDKAARAVIADRALTGELKPQDAIKELRALPDPMAALKEARKTGFKSLPQLQQERRAPEPPAPPQRSQAAPMGQPTATGPNGQRMIFNGQAWVPLT